jgi:serine/threonine protein kinase
MLDVGSQPIPGYRLTQRLGTGTFGDVWEAQGADGKLIALKVIDCRNKASAHLSGQLDTLRALSELRHPNLIEFFSIQLFSPFLFLSMERADGSLDDLHKLYRRDTGKNIPADHVLEILTQVADVLDFLSTAPVPVLQQLSPRLQHCDIKPSNLLLVGDNVKIGDLGLSALSSWRTPREGWAGTPPFAAPELYQGQASPGTDQFALAITFLKLCAGERPFWPNAVPDAPPRGSPVDLKKLRERELPILARALHADPAARYPTCQGFVKALREAIHAARPPLSLPISRVRPTLPRAGIPATSPFSSLFT